MIKAKDFDCVELKNSIQQRLRAERAGLSDVEIEEVRRQRLETSDHPAAALWRKLVARERDSTVASRRS